MLLTIDFERKTEARKEGDIIFIRCMFRFDKIALMKRNKEKHPKIKTVVIILVSIISQIVLIWVAVKVANIKNDVPSIGTQMDFSNQSSSGKVVYPYGDYKFYYNQWLKTDKIENPVSDGTISLPNTWAGKSIERGGKEVKLTSYGYASFQITLANMQKDQWLSIAKYDYGDSIRVYFDNQLVYEYGNLSKDKEYNDITGNNYSKSYFKTTGDTIVMTIEVGNSGHGGLKMIPNITTSLSTSRWSSFSEAVIFFCFGILFASLLTSLVFLLSDIKNVTNVFIFLLTCILFLGMVFSTDGLMVFNRFSVYPDFFLFRYLNRIMTSLYIYGITLSEAKISNRLNFKTAFVNSLVFLTTVFTMFALFDTGYFYMYYWTILVSFFVYLYYYITGSQTKLSHLNFATIAFTIGDLIFETPYSRSQLGYDNKGIFSSFTAIRSTLFIIYFITVLMKYIKSVQNYNRLYKEQRTIRDNTLKQQIQPHYLFNTLSVIRHFYHKDLAEGDEMMAMFSDNFRESVKNMKESMIPFEKEIETIIKYIELENRCYEKPFNLILDLDFVDFKVPPLTLEPLVENSVNYSHVNEKTNGFISISSDYVEGNVIIIVNDNGLGYDTTKVSKTSIGQKNLIERLSYHLNAKIKIESSLGNGTKTTIVFPYRSEDSL